MPLRPLRRLAAIVVLPLAFAALAPGARAQSAAPSSPVEAAPVAQDGALPVTDHAPLVVTGVQPGPGLWKVSKGDHVMWVLGTQSPLPRGMRWESAEVEAALAASQEVLYAPVVGFSVDAGGFFRNLLVLPRLYGARKNPDGRTLREVLPPDLYARWLPLRERYLGKGRAVERMRPLFAAGELWEEALRQEGLALSGVVMPVLARAVKAYDLRETRPERTLEVTDPKALLAEIEHAQLDDARCLEATIARLEDIARLRRRANAWAEGDIAALRALPDVRQNSACAEAAMQSPAMRKRGAGALPAEVAEAWLEAAEAALARNSGTFALLPVDDLLSGEGYLARLAARGYEVTAPE